jgi:hypothetical protein
VAPISATMSASSAVLGAFIGAHALTEADAVGGADPPPEPFGPGAFLFLGILTNF